MGGGSGRRVFVRHQQWTACAVITSPCSEEDEVLGVRVPCLLSSWELLYRWCPDTLGGLGQRTVPEAPAPEPPASWQLWSEDMPPGQALGLVTHRV